ncbi:MAG: acyl-CoA thioesterase [Rhodobacteraceae bacterium]|nr:acyl-CoA thioesterase [Paracoccaceae bacterium]
MNKQTYAGGPAPYIHEVRVGWGHCDPAQIAFTGHIPWFALEAIDAWWEVHLDGTGWFQLNIDRNVGTPFVHMSLDFSSPVTPRHPLMCEVAPVRIGTKSIEFQVIGRQDGRTCFQGRFVSVFVISDQHGVSIPAPEDIRAVVEAHLLPEPQPQDAR